MTTLQKALKKREEAVSAGGDGSNYEALQKDIDAVREKFKGVKQYEVLSTKDAGVYKAVETPKHKMMRMEVMNVVDPIFWTKKTPFLR
jgi:hypothetical protein